jgi:hypothetical protein
MKKERMRMQSSTNSAGAGSDMPIGLGMLLMGDQLAFSRFGELSPEEKKGVLHYVESGADGEEAKRRIEHTVKSLHDGVPGFYLQ